MEKKTKTLSILIIILSVLILVLGGYIIYDKSSEKEVDTNERQENNEEENANNEESISTSQYSIQYYLNNNEEGFLGTNSDEPTKYQLLESYEDYTDTINKLDLWASNSITAYKEYLDAKANEQSEIYTQEEVDDIIAKYTQRINELTNTFKQSTYNETYFEKNSLLLVEVSTTNFTQSDTEFDHICLDNNNLNVYINTIYHGIYADNQSVIFFINLVKNDIKDVDNITIEINYDGLIQAEVKKPIIYLYPTQEEYVSVKLGYPDNITTSYPHYTNGWNVLAKPNGDLIDTDTNKNLYSLYYESNNIIEFEVENEGFVIKGIDVANFLEEKLTILGLNDKEKEEFIIYWLPRLKKYNYVYIRFASLEEIDENMPLEIIPTPDTTIRVLMTFKELDNPINIKEQKLTTPSRTGFTAVEWGGTEIK